AKGRKDRGRRRKELPFQTEPLRRLLQNFFEPVCRDAVSVQSASEPQDKAHFRAQFSAGLIASMRRSRSCHRLSFPQTVLLALALNPTPRAPGGSCGDEWA